MCKQVLSSSFFLSLKSSAIIKANLSHFDKTAFE